MRFVKNLFVFIFILFICSLNFSCVTFESMRKAEISYVVDEKNPVRDDSFPVTWESKDAFTMEFEEEKRDTLVDFLVGKNIIPASKNRRVVCYGTLSEVDVKNNQDKLSVVKERLFPHMKKNYRWDGFVTYGGFEHNVRLNMKVKGKDFKRRIYVTSADCGLVSVKVHAGFGSNGVKTPLKIATVYDASGKYDVYVVKNKNYAAFGKDSSNEALVKRNMPKTSVRELLNLKGQVFQIVDASGTAESDADGAATGGKRVIAECKNDRYRILLSEDDERYESMVQSAGFLCTYVNVMNRVDSIKKVE